MTDRAARWATEQVGRLGRTVAEIARDLGCDWHTVSDAVVAYGSVLVDDPDRIGTVSALGLDETLLCRRGRWHRQEFCTSIVDVSPTEAVNNLIFKRIKRVGFGFRSFHHYRIRVLSGDRPANVTYVALFARSCCRMAFQLLAPARRSCRTCRCAAGPLPEI